MARLVTILFTLFSLIYCPALLEASASTPQIIIMRHGESDHNVLGVYNSSLSSSTPSNLTEQGKEQARKTAGELLKQGFNDNNIVAVYVSPLPRTMQTAQILVDSGLISANKLHQDCRLIEVQAGTLEGLPLLKDWNDSYTVKYQSENEAALQKRISDFFQELKSQKLNGNILVVTHNIPAQKLMDLLLVSKEKLPTGGAKAFSWPQD